ncbi:MAG: type II secretion system protein [Bacilli bacterium]|nr:type II secretion system protein [Bacilli bacterium]
MKRKNRKGFTLVELLATVVIMGIVVLIAIPAYSAISNSLKKRQNKNIFSYIETQASKYASENNLYSDIDQTTITVQTLLQSGYVEADNKAGTKVIDAFGKDITCYQVRIDFENGKPVPKFIEEEVSNQDGICILDDLKVKKLIQLDAYKASSLSESAKITVENNRTYWVKEDVILKLKILDANLNARRNEQITNIDWNAVNENKSYSNKDANWTTVGWLDNITLYNQATEYKNVYRVSTSTIMNDTKFKISLTVNYIDDAGKKINETLTTYLVVRIDKELPTVTASVDTNWTKTNKKIYVTGNDKQGSGIDYFCIYDSEVTNYQCSKTSANAIQLKAKSTNKGEVAKPAGTYYIWAVDKVGNWSLNPARVVVGNIDTTGPNCVYENQNTNWKTGAHTITVKCDDGNDGSGCITKPYIVTYADDSKTYSRVNLLTSYIITDYAGNKTTCTGPVNVYIDNKAPTLSVTHDKKRTATITAHDDAELKKYEIYNGSTLLKSENISGNDLSITYDQNIAGTYTVKVYDVTDHVVSKQFKVSSYTVTCEDYFVDASNNNQVKLGSSTKKYNYGETASGTDWGTDSAKGTYYTNYVYKSSTSSTVPDNNNLVVYRRFYAWTDLNIYYADGTTQQGATVSFKVGNGSWKDVKNEDNTIQPYGTTYYIKNIRPVNAYEEIDKVEKLTYDSANGYYYFKPTSAGNVMKIFLKYKKFSFDLNGNLDGTTMGNIAGYGTADVYINGTQVGENITDYYESWPYGTTYEIKDIRANTGRVYDGVTSGSISGTIGNGNVSTSLKFTTKTAKVIFHRNINSSDTTTKTQTFKYGDSNLSFANTGFAKTGYALLGWSQNSGATSATYSVNNGVNNNWIIGVYDGSYSNSNHEIHLYAVWKQNLPSSQTVFSGGKIHYKDWDGTIKYDDSGFNHINSGCTPGNITNSNFVDTSYYEEDNNGTKVKIRGKMQVGAWYGQAQDNSSTQTITIKWNGYKKAAVTISGTYNRGACNHNAWLWVDAKEYHNQTHEEGCWEENGTRKCSCVPTNSDGITYPKHTVFYYTSSTGQGTTTITLKGRATKPASTSDNNSWVYGCLVVESIVMSDPV